MKVIVFQCPCGTRSTNRLPRTHRPCSRIILLFADVSSMNTSRVASNMPEGHPDLTLDEVVGAMRKRKISGSRTAMWRFFQRHKITV
jgi:hypothetical protein